ncbi:Crp/Fnr family transcriptional regulator [Microbacter margulisiae]|uniref:CRP/FNR family transcriptional regulator n=1 Tax=Microbacter margulisiae TaxID=1350067 RepID=A0A7W5DRD4_9PORP|nr:Crp/Fnr family transcriptional regulator [Microbacter margulisiae]MBB3187631.1 CRP/FNR family transcriptional regulator [Microbacter margulisiae]
MQKTACQQCVLQSDSSVKLIKNQLDELTDHCSQVEFKPGEIIFKENAISTNVVYLRRGLVKIHTDNFSKDRILRLTKAPSYLCLPGVLGNSINRFSATAIEPTVACFIDIHVFKKFILENGDFAYKIILELSQNEIKSFQVSLNLAQKQANGRVADALLYFSHEIYNAQTFVLPFSRQELGDWMGISRESVSRILGEFHSAHIIDQSGKEITILNEELLQQISQKG